MIGAMHMIQDFAGRRGIFYGWFTLLGVMLIVFIVGGSFFNSFAVMLPVICQDFGWSRAAVAAGLSLGVMAFGLPSPLFGMLVARLGPRFAFIAGNITAAFGLAGMSLIQDIWHIYLLYIFIGAGAGFGGYIASATVVNNWFIRKRSLAMGLFVGCMGLAGFVFPPFVTILIRAVGWRGAWLILSALVLVFSVLIAGLAVIRNRPEDLGLAPDGDSSTAVATVPDQKIPAESKPGTGTPSGRYVLSMAVTWLIGLFVAANAFASGTFNTHQIAYLQDMGFPAFTAALTMSVMAGSNTIGSLVFGTLAMRLHARYLAIGAFALQLIALSILLSMKQIAMIYLFAGIMGVSVGALIAAMPTLVGIYFSREKYSQALGVVFPFQLIAQAVAATVAGIIYDTAASYRPAFVLALAVSVCGLICVVLMRAPRVQQ